MAMNGDLEDAAALMGMMVEAIWRRYPNSYNAVAPTALQIFVRATAVFPWTIVAEKLYAAFERTLFIRRHGEGCYFCWVPSIPSVPRALQRNRELVEHAVRFGFVEADAAAQRRFLYFTAHRADELLDALKAVASGKRRLSPNIRDSQGALQWLARMPELPRAARPRSARPATNNSGSKRAKKNRAPPSLRP